MMSSNQRTIRALIAMFSRTALTRALLLASLAACSDQATGADSADGGTSEASVDCTATYDVGSYALAEAILQEGGKICVQSLGEDGNPIGFSVFENAACECDEPDRSPVSHEPVDSIDCILTDAGPAQQ